MQDLALMIDGELADKFGVIPEYGDNCQNLLKDYFIGGTTDAWDGLDD